MKKREIYNSTDLWFPGGTKRAICNVGADRLGKYVNSLGFYWISNSKSNHKAWRFKLASDTIDVISYDRYIGLTIRHVFK